MREPLTEYQRLRGLIRWRQEQEEILAFLERWSRFHWELPRDMGTDSATIERVY
jgi:hypothetical protein